MLEDTNSLDGTQSDSANYTTNCKPSNQVVAFEDALAVVFTPSEPNKFPKKIEQMAVKERICIP